MAKYRITGPDGATYEVTAPDDATPEQVQAFVQQNLAPTKPAGPKGNAADGGVMGGVKMGLRDPIDAGAQLLTRVLPDSWVRAGNRLNNALADAGLPLARLQETPTDKPEQAVDALIKQAGEQYEADRAAAGRSGFDAARLTGNVANPVNLIPAGGVVKGVQGVRQLAVAGAKAGALGGALQPVVGDTENFWGTKAAQVGLGTATGGLLTPVLAKGAEGVARGGQALLERVRPRTVTVGGTPLTAQQLDVAVNRVLQSQGMRLEEAPEAILGSVRRQVSEALQQRAQLDPAAALRRAQAEAIGLTDDAALTAGQLSRNPIQLAQEKNLSGIVINTPAGPGNALADRMQAQAQALQRVFDNAGARGAVPPTSAGEPLMDALRAADAPRKAGVDALYETARRMNAGRAAELDRAAFNQTVNSALDEGMWGRFLPAEARGFINDIAEGKVPFTVESTVMIDSRLSELQRAAQRQGNSAAANALGVVRRQLQDVPFAQAMPEVRTPGVAEAAQAAGVVDNGIDDVAFREVTQPALPAPPGRAVSTGAEFDLPPGAAPGTAMTPAAAPGAQRMSPGEEARRAFEEARRAARARFATIEDTPALKAALDGDSPADFVRKFVIGGKPEDLQAMRQVLANSPEAMGQVRAQIAAHLKRAAFGDNLSGDGGFAPARLATAIRNIGPERLSAFFGPEEVMRFNLAAKVASDLESGPAGARYAVNRSATSAGVFNLLQRILESPMARSVPGVRSLGNQVSEIANERAIRQALQPASAAAQPARELSPEAVRAIQRLLAPAAVGSGAAAGSGF